MSQIMLHYENKMGEKQHLLTLRDESTLHQRTDVKWRLLPAEIVFELQIFEVEVSTENSRLLQACRQ